MNIWGENEIIVVSHRGEVSASLDEPGSDTIYVHVEDTTGQEFASTTLTFDEARKIRDHLTILVGE